MLWNKSRFRCKVKINHYYWCELLFTDWYGYHSVTRWTLSERHNERHGVSNHQHLDCLFNRLFRHTSKKKSKLLVTGRCVGNPPVTGGFPSQRPVARRMFPFDDVSHHVNKAMPLVVGMSWPLTNAFSSIPPTPSYCTVLFTTSSPFYRQEEFLENMII